MAAALVSTVVTIVMDPLGDLERRVLDVAPWAGAGLIASESLFVGGIMLMASAVGLGWGSPLKLRKALQEICRRANGSRVFWLGFWINSVGAAGSSAILSIGVLLCLPPESYGLLGLTLADLAVTFVIRKAMLNGVRKAAL